MKTKAKRLSIGVVTALAAVSGATALNACTTTGSDQRPGTAASPMATQSPGMMGSDDYGPPAGSGSDTGDRGGSTGGTMDTGSTNPSGSGNSGY